MILKLLFLFTPFFINCQEKAGVWGKLNVASVTHKWLYIEYYDGAVACKLNFATAIAMSDLAAYIIGDTSCLGKSKAYIIVKDSRKYLMDVKDFSNNSEIDQALIKIKELYPSIEVREKQAIIEMPNDLKEFEKEQERLRLEQDKKLKKELDSLQKLIDKSLTVYREKNWVLWSWSWGYSNEYSKFVDVDITVINPYKKKIKYIWFTVSATNPVGDAVKDGITGKSEKIVQGVGPIEYGDRGTYNFEDVYYSSVIEKMKMKQIKIQFFDGTFKIISNPNEIQIE